MTSNDSATWNSTWILTNANGLNGTPSWQQLNVVGPLPAPRFGEAAVYDSSSNRMIIFGGAGSFGFANDVWVLSNANGLGGSPAWTQLAPTGTPPSPRRYLNAVYDSTANRMILFGGCLCIQSSSDPQAFNEVWVLTNANGTETTTSAWILLSPTGTLPAPRSPGPIAYDSTTNRMIVMGGGGSPVSGSGLTLFNDVWVLSNANGLGGTASWSELIPNGAPDSPPNWSSGIYNPTNNRATVFGGVTTTATATNNVWVLQHANGLGGNPTWVQLSPTGVPPQPRTSNNAIYDSVSDRMTIFSGETGPSATLLNDTWVLTNATSISGTQPLLLSTVPDTGQLGQTLSLTVTGQLTHFLQGSTQISLGPDITVNGVTVSSATSLTANITIPANASLGGHTVTVTTGTEVASLTNGFSVTSSALTIIQISPNSGQQGQQNLSIAITGQLTHFVQDTTTANFGAGITVASLSVNSGSTAIAVVNIDPAAILGARNVTLTTGGEIASLSNGFSVVSSTFPAITTVTPNAGPQGQGGPVGIVGQNTHFVQGTTQVSFGVGITVSNITITCLTCLSVQLQIDLTATVGPRTVTVTTGTEVVSLASGFTVLAGSPILTSLNPAGGQQGQTLQSRSPDSLHISLKGPPRLALEAVSSFLT